MLLGIFHGLFLVLVPFVFHSLYSKAIALPPSYHFVVAVWRAKKSVFPAKNYVDSVPASFAVSRRAKLFGRLPLELHLTLFPQGNRERKVRSHN